MKILNILFFALLVASTYALTMENQLESQHKHKKHRHHKKWSTLFGKSVQDLKKGQRNHIGGSSKWHPWKQLLVSKNGRFFAIVHPKTGNLVVFKRKCKNVKRRHIPKRGELKKAKSVWGTVNQTSGLPTRLHMQTDGNVALYSNVNKQLWDSDTEKLGKGRRLVLGNNGSLKIKHKKHTEKVIFKGLKHKKHNKKHKKLRSASSHTHHHKKHRKHRRDHWACRIWNKLYYSKLRHSGGRRHSLRSSKKWRPWKNVLVSSNKKYFAVLTKSGNFAVFKRESHKHRVPKKTEVNAKFRLWSAKQKGGRKLKFNKHGSLVLLGKEKKVLWESKSKGKRLVLKLTNKGSLVILRRRRCKNLHKRQKKGKKAPTHGKNKKYNKHHRCGKRKHKKGDKKPATATAHPKGKKHKKHHHGHYYTLVMKVK